jgi:DNA polymerase III epsilon subunit-like protein
MKWNNHIVVFDLETTGCDRQAITEIGAVALTGDLSRVEGRFQSLVYPDYPVTEKSLEITGHNPDELMAADPWPKVVVAFEMWISQQTGKPTNRSRLAAWGNYFDVNVLRNQYGRHGLAYPFSGTCIDVKTAALMWAACSGRRTDSLSVEGCAKEMNLTPLGPYHRADVDADMTGQIFGRVMYELAGGVWIGKQYVYVGTFDD